MSMVGYILGLGDRHPSNIMLDRFSGKIIHIDFGDCFEIAMRREVPWEDPFQTDKDADQSDGSVRDWRQFQDYLWEYYESHEGE